MVVNVDNHDKFLPAAIAALRIRDGYIAVKCDSNKRISIGVLEWWSAANPNTPTLQYSITPL
jgi:hypothetical protein